MKESADQSLSSIISVSKPDNEKAVGTFSAQENGDYFHLSCQTEQSFRSPLKTGSKPTQKVFV